MQSAEPTDLCPIDLTHICLPYLQLMISHVLLEMSTDPRRELYHDEGCVFFFLIIFCGNQEMRCLTLYVFSDPHLRVVLIVFHHVSPEKARPLTLPTMQRVANRYQQCDVIYDAFFWQGKFYECENNDLFMEKFERYISR